jgi:hypothetical protein
MSIKVSSRDASGKPTQVRVGSSAVIYLLKNGRCQLDELLAAAARSQSNNVPPALDHASALEVNFNADSTSFSITLLFVGLLFHTNLLPFLFIKYCCMMTGH